MFESSSLTHWTSEPTGGAFPRPHLRPSSSTSAPVLHLRFRPHICPDPSPRGNLVVQRVRPVRTPRRGKRGGGGVSSGGGARLPNRLPGEGSAPWTFAEGDGGGRSSVDWAGGGACPADSLGRGAGPYFRDSPAAGASGVLSPVCGVWLARRASRL